MEKEILLILSAYISRHFLAAFIIILPTIAGLILLFDLIELTRRAATHSDLSFAILLGMSLLKLPQALNAVLPFTVLLGSMTICWRLSHSHELIIIRAIGISAWQFLSPILLIVLFLGIANVTLLNPLGAAMYAHYEQLENVLLLHRTNAQPSLFKDGLWLRDSVKGQQLIMYADHIRHERLVLYMYNISVFLFRAQDRFIERIEADNGVLQNEGYYELHRSWVMQPGTRPVYYDAIYLPTNITANHIRENFVPPEKMSVWSLPHFIHLFESSGFSARGYYLHLQTLIASPFLLCAMVLVAAAFVMPQHNKRNRGIPFRIVGVVGASFLLYFFSKIAYALGQSSAIPLTLAAWSPTVITGLLGFAALLHLEDG